MSAVDYTGIQNALETALTEDVRTNAARIYVEEEPQFGLMDAERVVAVFLEGRSAPAREQGLNMGKRTRFHLRASAWVFAFSLESFRKSCEARNDLLGAVEQVLMDNRTLGDKIATLWLEGGAMFSARAGGNTGPFVAGAEVSFTMEVQAIN